MKDTLVFTLSSPEFKAALVPAGLILAAASILLVLPRRRRPLPLGGLAFAAAGLFVLSGTPAISAGLLVGVAVHAAFGLIRDLTDIPPAAQVVLGLPGAWLVGNALPFSAPPWLVPLTIAVLAVGGPLFSAFDRLHPRPALGPAFLAVVVAAGFATLPDTEEIRSLLPVAAAVALAGWPMGTMRLGGAGIHAALALLASVTAWDGRGRPAAIIGVVAALAVPVVWAGMLGAFDRYRPPATLATALVLAGVHVMVAVVAARVVGLRASVPVAAILAALTVTVTILVLGVGGRARLIRRTPP